MPLHFLYRKRSGQVLGASTDPSAYSAADPAYFGVATDPLAPDGTDLRPPKVYEPLINTMRLATQAEIDGFALAEYQDRWLQERDLMLSEIAIEGDGNTLHDIGNLTQRAQWRYVIRALNQAINQLNTLRQWVTTLKAHANAGTNYGAFRTLVLSLPDLPDLPTITKSQAITDYTAEWDKG